jgi:glycine/D-amino acid oxidase-like deaminating enzyme
MFAGPVCRSESDRVRAGAWAIAICATFGFMAGPVQAQTGMTVSPPPPPPVHVGPPPAYPYPYPVYPLPGWVHPDSVRCEQDRLLTDTRPCGSQTESATPLPPCQQDRLLTDTTPCTKP